MSADRLDRQRAAVFASFEQSEAHFSIPSLKVDTDLGKPRVYTTSYTKQAVDIFRKKRLALPYIPHPISSNDDQLLVRSALGAVLLANLDRRFSESDLGDCVWALGDPSRAQTLGADLTTIRKEQLDDLISHIGGELSKDSQFNEDPELPWVSQEPDLTDKRDDNDFHTLLSGREYFINLTYLWRYIVQNRYEDVTFGPSPDADDIRRSRARDASVSDSAFRILTGATRYDRHVVHGVRIFLQQERVPVAIPDLPFFQNRNECRYAYTLIPAEIALQDAAVGMAEDDPAKALRFPTPAYDPIKGPPHPFLKTYDPANPPTKVVGLNLFDGELDMTETQSQASYNVIARPLIPALLPPKNVTLTDSQVFSIIQLLERDIITAQFVHESWPSTFDRHGDIHLNRLQHGPAALLWVEKDDDWEYDVRESGYYFVTYKGLYTLCGGATVRHLIGSDTKSKASCVPLAHQRPLYGWDSDKDHYRYDLWKKNTGGLYRADLRLTPKYDILLKDMPSVIDYSHVDELFLQCLRDCTIVAPTVRNLIRQSEGTHNVPNAVSPVNYFNRFDSTQITGAQVADTPLIAYIVPKDMKKRCFEVQLPFPEAPSEYDRRSTVSLTHRQELLRRSALPVPASGSGHRPTASATPGVQAPPQNSLSKRASEQSKNPRITSLEASAFPNLPAQTVSGNTLPSRSTSHAQNTGNGSSARTVVQGTPQAPHTASATSGSQTARHQQQVPKNSQLSMEKPEQIPATTSVVQAPVSDKTSAAASIGSQDVGNKSAAIEVAANSNPAGPIPTAASVPAPKVAADQTSEFPTGQAGAAASSRALPGPMNAAAANNPIFQTLGAPVVAAVPDTAKPISVLSPKPFPANLPVPYSQFKEFINTAHEEEQENRLIDKSAGMVKAARDISLNMEASLGHFASAQAEAAIANLSDRKASALAIRQITAVENQALLDNNKDQMSSRDQNLLALSTYRTESNRRFDEMSNNALKRLDQKHQSMRSRFDQELQEFSNRFGQELQEFSNRFGQELQDIRIKFDQEQQASRDQFKVADDSLFATATANLSAISTQEHASRSQYFQDLAAVHQAYMASSEPAALKIGNALAAKDVQIAQQAQQIRALEERRRSDSQRLQDALRQQEDAQKELKMLMEKVKVGEQTQPLDSASKSNSKSEKPSSIPVKATALKKPEVSEKPQQSKENASNQIKSASHLTTETQTKQPQITASARISDKSTKPNLGVAAGRTSSSKTSASASGRATDSRSPVPPSSSRQASSDQPAQASSAATARQRTDMEKRLAKLDRQLRKEDRKDAARRASAADSKELGQDTVAKRAHVRTSSHGSPVKKKTKKTKN